MSSPYDAHFPGKFEEVIFCVQGVVSPLLSNLLLDELDKELEKRQLKFVRYADDCNIYVKSRRAGERVMQSISKYLTKKLKLKVNEQKSAVGWPQERKFLGFSFTEWKQRTIALKSVNRFKDKIRELTRRHRGGRWETILEELSRYLRGWRNYFAYCEVNSVLSGLDAWIRRRLRCLIWRRWKTFKNRRKQLMKRGVGERKAVRLAISRKGPWALSKAEAMHIAFPNDYFRRVGLLSLTQR